MTTAPSTFVLLLTYIEPLDAIDALLPEHRQWLAEQYDAGRFLASGPQVPREGGVILARAADRDEMMGLVATDPFSAACVARYTVVEFRPTAGPLADVLAGSSQPVA